MKWNINQKCAACELEGKEDAEVRRGEERCKSVLSQWHFFRGSANLYTAEGCSGERVGEDSSDTVNIPRDISICSTDWVRHRVTKSQ